MTMRKNDTEAMRLAGLYRDWLHESTLAMSPHTIASYKEAFRCLMGYLEDNKGLGTGSLIFKDREARKTGKVCRDN